MLYTSKPLFTCEAVVWLGALIGRQLLTAQDSSAETTWLCCTCFASLQANWDLFSGQEQDCQEMKP